MGIDKTNVMNGQTKSKNRLKYVYLLVCWTETKQIAHERKSPYFTSKTKQSVIDLIEDYDNTTY